MKRKLSKCMKIESIKFKAKRLSNGEWVVGSLIISTAGVKEKTYIVDKFSSMSDYSIIGVDPSTVCQFTGLKDCEGKEVWEGDILEGSNKGEICFEQGAFLIHSIDDNTLYSLSNYTTWDGKITCKVIGNKFDKEK